jgi:SAM-dependent methyltransferase
MSNYVLGSDEPEIARLDGQAAVIERATRVLLRAAGIAPGMRVLDLGCGLGHVAFIAAEVVGPEGRVIGIDASARLLAVADERRRAAGIEHLRFCEGDVRTWRDEDPFDAIVGRLILSHLPDAVAVARHHMPAIRHGAGVFVAIDFDVGGARAEPQVPLVTQALEWVRGAFRRAGADPTIGTRLAMILGEAGLQEIQSYGLQEYCPPGDPRGPALLSGLVHALAPQIVDAGLATDEQLGLRTLQARIAHATEAAGAVMLPPTVVGAWGRRM